MKEKKSLLPDKERKDAPMEEDVDNNPSSISPSNACPTTAPMRKSVTTMAKEASDYESGRVPQETVQEINSSLAMIDKEETLAKINFFQKDNPKHAPPANKSASTLTSALQEIPEGPKNGLQLIQGTEEVFFSPLPGKEAPIFLPDNKNRTPSHVNDRMILSLSPPAQQSHQNKSHIGNIIKKG